MRTRVAGLAGAAVLLAALLGWPASAEEPGGVVITRVAGGSAAERSDLRPGDRLLRWEQGDASGTLDSPFDLHEVELERAPHGEVHVSGLREGVPLTVALFPDDWGLEVRPPLPAEAVAIHEEARHRLEAGDVEKGVGLLRSLEGRAGETPPPGFDLWVQRETAVALAQARRTAEAQAISENAANAAAAQGRRPAAVQLWTLLGTILGRADRLDEAHAALTRALTLRQELGPDSLAVAANLIDLALLEFRRGKDSSGAQRRAEAAQAIYERLAPRSLALAHALDTLTQGCPFEQARALLDRALKLKEELAPDSLAVADTLDLLTTFTPDAVQAVELARRALALRERLAPDSLEVAESASALAWILKDLGDLAGAEQQARRALAIRERLAPGSLEVAGSLNTLGNILVHRGDLTQAEVLLRRALAMNEAVAPGSVRVARQLHNLSYLLHRQGDDPTAETYARQALAILLKESPADDLIPLCLTNLGDLAHSRGDRTAARSFYDRAREIWGPDHPSLPLVQQRLGDLLVEEQRLDEAETLYRKALARAEKMSLRSPVRAEYEHALGMLALRRGDLDQAERHHQAALALRESAPGTLAEAESAHGLGLVARSRGRKEQALGFFRRAVGALEIQVKNLGTSPEVQTRFRARQQAIYRDLEELLLELDRPQEAFHVVESSRARSLLALLSARDLEFAAVPEPLERERRLADAEYDRALARLGSVPSTDDAQRERARHDLEIARGRQGEARALIRAAAPRLAAIRDPQPLDLAGVRRVLAPGTLLLTYSLGQQGSRLYAVGPGPQDFAVARIDLGEVAVREEVRRFRASIQTARGRLGRRTLLQQSEQLGQRLLSPIAGQLARAERVLVVPDGALHLLPFGALGLPAPQGQHRFLIEAKPLHIASSVTLYAELSRPEPEKSATGDVVGFGDPLYPRASGDEAAALRGAVRSGLRLDPLPWTRSELAALKRVAAKEPRLWLGAEATEQRAKSLAADSRIVHFACHAFVDEAFPLESGLALSIPRPGQQGEENGLLQAWEVFEKVRVDADLVTLSACQTAVGKEFAGEGLLGLTWAFQYAGARSVLASLWEVSDASTADLMRRFYGHWGRGGPKAEALRRAQLELLKHPATSAPFYWAAFELIGDWR